MSANLQPFNSEMLKYVLNVFLVSSQTGKTKRPLEDSQRFTSCSFHSHHRRATQLRLSTTDLKKNFVKHERINVTKDDKSSMMIVNNEKMES
ncbi:Hypothetical predicted protein [Scomber scombrus]|uniref:Uncharacterized protein n=1 Tax=Scomber scombrus TaxID=13677 RepID=A0AAV1QGF6_SCOSC